MAKRIALSDTLNDEPERDPVTTSSRDDAAPKKRRKDSRPHQSIYASPEVFKALRDIANKRDCKMQDLFAEGLRIVMAKNGYDFDRLNGRS